MDLLIDTCVMVWSILDPSKLTQRAAIALEDPDALIHFSSVSVGEIACAVDRGRLELAEHWKPWLRKHVEANGWTCLAVDWETVNESYSLPPPFHQDPVDRIIVATARLRRMNLITGDSKILSYPHVTTLW